MASPNLLFSPVELRDVRLRNRIVLSPMMTYAAQGGFASDWHFAHLGQYAAGGVGLVFTESTKIDPRGCTTPHDLGLWKDEFVPGLKRIADYVKSQGAAVGIQLGHSGRKARNAVPWKGRAPLDSHPGVDHGEDWELIGPSALAHSPRAATPREMALGDVQEILACWKAAAARADAAGFDVLEIHGGHGYLIHQFLSACANQRTDRYGGSLTNRMRFAAETAASVREAWPQAKPLFFRISAVDEAGWSIDDSVELARALKREGVDVIDCSSGGMAAPSIDSTQPQDYGYQVPYAERIRAAADIRTMAVGLIIHADQAEDILRNGRADLVAVGRELLHNPHWSLDAAEKLGVAEPFATVPPQYGYWLEKRSRAGFERRTSTWQVGMDPAPGQDTSDGNPT
jgi:2,4-dienoyl-CoA reductase-like NADH-dependent reductase (Old Yellow Enzyme family)